MNWTTSLTRLPIRFYWRRYLSRNATPWDELERFPRLSPDDQRRALATKLMAQLRYFGNRADSLPEWRDAAAIRDPDDLWRIWPTLPILGKRHLQERFDTSEIRRRFRLEGRVDATGGSTGEPIRFFHDRRMILATVASTVCTQLRMGWKLGMPTVCVWGSERDIGRSVSLRTRLHHRLLNNFPIDGYNLTPETARRVCQIVRRHPGAAVYGFTSMLGYVAEQALENRWSPGPGAVLAAWNGGEMLFPGQCDLFRRAFGVPILNRYGGRELGPMACQYREDGPLWVLRPWLFLEVVNESGKPAAPGETGRLIWTSTICRGTPFLRYDIEDLGVFDAAHSDESGVTALRALEGRRAGLLELAGGRKVSALFWNHAFKGFPEVRQFQVVLKSGGSIEFLLEGPGLSPAREAELTAVLRGFLRAIPFRLTWVGSIPRTPLGKLIQVVKED